MSTVDESTESFKAKIRSISFVGRGKANRTSKIRDNQAREAAEQNVPTSRG